MATKQIKDYSTVVTVGDTDNLITQQATDSICRKVTPSQLIGKYSTTYTRTLLLKASKTEVKTELSIPSFASSDDAKAGTETGLAMAPSTTKVAIESIAPGYTDLESGATTELDSITSLYINITGTTGITSFGTAASGLYRYLTFAGSLTITKGASLICPGNEDIVTQAGDTAKAVCGASNVWTIVSYTRANGMNILAEELIAIIREEQVSDTDGGAFTNGADRTRTLNTINYNKYGTGVVSLASNQFTITPSGTQTFRVEWAAPATMVGGHSSFLYDVPAIADRGRSWGAFSNTGTTTKDYSEGVTHVTISSATAYEIRHRCTNTKTVYGFGYKTSIGTEIYTVVKIYRVRQ